MSKILVISPIPTHPVTAGNRARVAALTNSLEGLGHTVYFMHAEQEAGDAEAMRAHWGDRYVPVPYQRPSSRIARRRRRAARALGLKAAFQYGLDEWYDPSIDQHLDSFLAANEIDVVIVEYVFMSRALLRVPAGVFKVIDTHDVFAERHKRYLANGIAPTWFSCSTRAEVKGLNRADGVIAIQKAEAAYFRQVTGSRVATIGHPISLRPQLEQASEQELEQDLNKEMVPGRILLVGSDNAINIASLDWYLQHVHPLILQACPHAELAVAGTACRRLAPSPGMRLLGRLDDLASAYATAQVVVNPMLFGTGLKIKSVEAFGYARALVTTPCGAEGLEARAGRAFRSAREPGEFAQEVVSLLNDRSATNVIAREGYRFALDMNAEILANLTAMFGTAPQHP